MQKTVSFLALVFTALALVPYCAHVFSLPNKIGMTQEQYFIAQSVYRNWALVGLILFPAMLINLVFAYLLRAERPALWLALLGCVCMAITLPVFFIWTYPANVATQNWTGAAGQPGRAATAMGILPRGQRGSDVCFVLPGSAGERHAAPVRLTLRFQPACWWLVLPR